MIVRVLTSIVTLPLIILLLYSGGWPLHLIVFICSAISLDEIYRALSKKKLFLHNFGYLLSAAYIFILNDFSLTKFIIVFSSFIIALLVALVFNHSRINIIDCIITFFGFFYVTFLLSFILLVREQAYGKFFVWLIFISAWGCDTFAYFFGRTLGKNKLIPSLSPKKTIEGAIGGIFGAVLLSTLYCFIFARRLPFYSWNLIFLCAIICFVASIFAQLGDLSASAIKRYGNLKDYGNILPGHGGILDRFDSVLFTAPIVYMSLFFIRKFVGGC